MTYLSCNGQPMESALTPTLLVNYGHFTSLQVRAGAVQGWDLHLQRLQQGSRELFGSELDARQLQGWLQQALQAFALEDASLRITVFSRQFDFRQPLQPVPLDVLIGLTPPATMPTTARAVLPVVYQRELPHLKHVGTFPLFHLRREAMRQGFDDALLVDADGRVCEGSTWNLAFWDGAQVVWPKADALRGTAEQLLVRSLDGLGQVQLQRPVSLEVLPGFTGAVACNATGLWPLGRIGGQVFEQSDALLRLLRQALTLTPWHPPGQSNPGNLAQAAQP
ncbi:aminotransferase class IV family protein [Stenotrophomonas sp.]|uniref:aminotransferase class IV family protein n=1 Tax=Stenotrophomonas sp. TaxID=69392 RepID=UPI0028AA5CE2|nr:aminotransferase class IV family protein [Stenotrophomonas sp.]